MPKPTLRLVKPDDPQDLTRPCYKLMPDRGRSAEDRRITKFGGLPFWPARRKWPVCTGCDQPLSFLGQIRSDEIPGLPTGFPRLMSSFYCFDCAPWWDVNGRGFHAEWLPLGGDPVLMAAKHTPLSVRAVTPMALKIQVATDRPGMQDWPNSDHINHAQRDLVLRVGPYKNSKMLGWPAWLQGAQVPNCRHCGGPMSFLGQFCSHAPIGAEFGANGRLYWFDCQAHCQPDALSLIVQDE
jgi:hypothetical protein